MTDTLPGTTIELDKKSEVSGFLSSLFSAGGLVLSQVLSLTGLNMHTVQNWVKRKYVGHPVNKKYDCDQFCTIVILNMLVDTFYLDDIRRLLDYVELAGENTATVLYVCFVEALADVSEERIDTISEAFAAIERRVSAADLGGEAKGRLRQAAEIMMLAHFASVRRMSAQERLDALDV